MSAYHAAAPHAQGDASKRCCRALDAGEPHGARLKNRERYRAVVYCSVRPYTAHHTDCTALQPKVWPLGRRRHRVWNAAALPAKHDAPPYDVKQNRVPHHALVDIRGSTRPPGLGPWTKEPRRAHPCRPLAPRHPPTLLPHAFSHNCKLSCGLQSSAPRTRAKPRVQSRDMTATAPSKGTASLKAARGGLTSPSDM